jgi:hypothetical protein
MPPPERTRADETRMGMSILDRTTQFDLDTLRSLREQQTAEKMGDRTLRKSNEAVTPDERHVGQAGAVSGSIMPKTAPPTGDRSQAQAQPDSSAKAPPAPAVAQPSEAAGKRVGQEPPDRQPSKPAIQAGSSPSAPKAELGLFPQPAGQGLSAESIESLTEALAVPLGMLAKLHMNRHLKDASSIEHLVSLLEKHIASNEDRFQFRVRAMHICKTFSNRRSDET